MTTLRTSVLPPLSDAMAGPVVLLVWGMAVAVLLWGSGVDVAIQVWLNDNYVQKFNTAMRLLGSLGKGSLQASLCLLLAAVWGYREWRHDHITTRHARMVLMTLPVFIVAGGINWLLKWGIGRGRPKEFLWNNVDPYMMSPFQGSAQWWSFPSGHSCSTFAIAVWLGLVFPRWRYLFWAMASLLSFSRFLALTPHYFGDVVAGATIGATVAWVIWILRVRLKCEREARKMSEVCDV